ncbi:MAG: hypothetical protein KKE02_23125 [Alphaproteobacteria bacterium]|nr:hypothetical protein [Alphaproteobacteria bacterium]MBU1517128.1 hypothetical protein [Alphaproteobacteria bacterium]MBU2093747.1 hypothetical protein [Alphaproteobacteria bacterium]MBU2153931.1 hypothetical protein [Alphaproteobacteria bacterium]MBU2308653.1 hypothetical protein [Alphaproteobacteria bacterium]
MTSISSLPYAAANASTYTAPAPVPTPTPAAPQGEATSTPAPAASAVKVTLSDAAKAALKAQAEAPTIASIAAAARSAIDKLLAQANTKVAIIDGRATIDLGGLDRRSLFAVASNAGGGFSATEQTLASATMAFQFEDTLAGPVAASRITGDYAGIYKAALAYLDKAGPEEKASAKWIAQREVLAKGYEQATATPGVAPKLPNDPVAAYIAAQAEDTPIVGPRDITKVADDVRAALNAQYAKAGDPDAAISLADFDDRALAAMALNKGGLFSPAETRAAQVEMRDRTNERMTEAYGSNIAAGSSATLGRDLIARYAGMSAEEREAQGWTPELYAKLVQNYQTSQKLTSMGASLAGGLYGGGSETTGQPSLMDYLT